MTYHDAYHSVLQPSNTLLMKNLEMSLAALRLRSARQALVYCTYYVVDLVIDTDLETHLVTWLSAPRWEPRAEEPGSAVGARMYIWICTCPAVPILRRESLLHTEFNVFCLHPSYTPVPSRSLCRHHCPNTHPTMSWE